MGTNRMLRAMTFVGAGLIIVQVLLLQQPAFAAERLMDVFADRMVQVLALGVIAFLLWIATGTRWPIVVWAVVVLMVSIDGQHDATAGSGYQPRDFLAADADARHPLLAPRAHPSSKHGD
jgi:hypothetical protein